MMGIINKNSKVRLTPVGRDAHDSGVLDGTDDQEFLIYLVDNGSSRIFSIADYTNMSQEAAVRLAKKLEKEGYIVAGEEPVNPVEEEDYGEAESL